MQTLGYKRGVRLSVADGFADIRQSKLVELLIIKRADVFGVEPAQLVRVEEGGRLGNTLGVKRLDKLGQSVLFTHTSRAPAEQSNIGY